ncbi:nitrate/nitrite transporter NarK [Stackebrandtia albiflava]|uniref:Nitrate/nitrite transporter NarK n=1 Tax=Stackebrandtia albiflava TaxID=406432 RepID=A0A562UYY4_9ACTN|nr:MFS transporter [Stackebrandtia albiflava]TWJ10803.1 nitrate/nitrite transporter NarK [Stackebrandtia albiflava]
MATPHRPGLTRARVAVTVAFIAHGVVFASWLPHIPQIKDDLGLSEGGLGLILLAPPAGAIAAMSLTGAACARFGSAAVTRVTAVAYTLGLTFIGLGAGNAWTLAAALLLAGALVGAFDVAMNSQAATVERATAKPIMGSFHAAWSLAAAAGAGIGGVAAQYEVPLWIQLLVLGLVALAAVAVFFPAFIPDAVAVAAGPARRWRFEKALVLLSLVAFAALLAEGAAADWSAVFLSDTQGASALVAAWGYGLFSVAMFLGRLAGDRLVHRIGRSRSIFTAALTGGLGMSASLVVAQLAGPGPVAQAAVIAGLFLLGLGIAVIVPVVFSAAGDGPGIAMVSNGGYTGWLLGPAVIGGLGELLGLPAAIWTIPLLAIVAALLAPIGLRHLSPERATTKA